MSEDQRGSLGKVRARESVVSSSREGNKKGVALSSATP